MGIAKRDLGEMETKVISRQRRWQLKKIAKGLCQTCGKETFKGVYCSTHYFRNLLNNRYRMRRLGRHNPKVEGSQGRPQIIPDLQIGGHCGCCG